MKYIVIAIVAGVLVLVGVGVLAYQAADRAIEQLSFPH